jgi:hypothetical protein
LPKETAPRKSLYSFMVHSSPVFRRCVPLVSWDLTAVSYLFVASLPVMYLLIAFRATSLQLTSRYFPIFLAVSSSILIVRFLVILGQSTHSSAHNTPLSLPLPSVLKRARALQQRHSVRCVIEVAFLLLYNVS